MKRTIYVIAICLIAIGLFQSLMEIFLVKPPIFSTLIFGGGILGLINGAIPKET